MTDRHSAQLPFESLVSLGFDWITATCTEGYSIDQWDSLCALLLTGEHQADNFAKPATLQGYEGIRCGQAFAGTRHDGAMVQLTGSLAQQFWRPVAEFATSIPRIDLQATIRIKGDPYSYVRRVDQAFRRAKKRRGRGPRIHFDRGENGGATAYVGRKSSRRYGRCYNKHAESGLEEYRGCVRWEAIFREDLGSRVMRFIQRSPSPRDSQASVIAGYFREVGGTSPAMLDAQSLLRLPVDFFSSQPLADARRKLLWLRTQVRPTVELLCNAGYAQMVEKALGLSQMVQSTDDEGD